MGSRLRNPYRPGAGVPPPVLAGRDGELARAVEALEFLGEGDPPWQGLLLFGPRGTGKTTLLDRIADEARQRGMRAEDLSATAFQSRETLIRGLQEKAALTGARIRDVRVAGVGVAVAPGAPTENADALLARWIGAGPRPLVILLDEIHTISPGAGRVFFNAIQVATRKQLSFWLLAAGTPDAPRRVREAATFSERAFRRVPMGRLERGPTMRALVEPARTSGLPLSDEAAALLAAESQDYPYFIQLLGSTAWDTAHAAGATEVTRELAGEAIATAREVIRDFYAERFNEARSHGIEQALFPLAAALQERGGRLDQRSLGPVLREIAVGDALPGGAGRLLDTLSDLGILWRRDAFRWEMGIPTFGDYVLSLASDAG